MRFTGTIRKVNAVQSRGIIQYDDTTNTFRASEIAIFFTKDVINRHRKHITAGMKVKFDIIDMWQNEESGLMMKRAGNIFVLSKKKRGMSYSNPAFLPEERGEEFGTHYEKDPTTGDYLSGAFIETLNNEPVTEEKGNPLLAFALFGKKIKLVTLDKDGKYQFLDETQSSHSIIYPSAFELMALQIAIEEFEDLINSTKASENDFQKFFERHPDFILNDDYSQAHPHIVLSEENRRDLIPDFVLEPVDQNSFCDLLEIKLPTASTYVLKKNRERYSSAVMEAAAQLRVYGEYFDRENNRKNFESKYPKLKIYKPRMFVIIGRQNNESQMLKREIQMGFPQLFLKTYDDLLTRIKWKKQNLERKNQLF